VRRRQFEDPAGITFGSKEGEIYVTDNGWVEKWLREE
jgi:hypothetical protein